jgi:hypothetical protein
MNLYLISQTENDDYDSFDSAVVCAENEDVARQTNPAVWDSPICNWSARHWHWCSAPELVTVRLIGVAAPDVPAGVVCASFNAG